SGTAGRPEKPAWSPLSWDCPIGPGIGGVTSTGCAGNFSSSSIPTTSGWPVWRCRPWPVTGPDLGRMTALRSTTGPESLALDSATAYAEQRRPLSRSGVQPMYHKYLSGLLLGLLSSLGTATLEPSAPIAADLILTNGKIWTVAKAKPEA